MLLPLVLFSSLVSVLVAPEVKAVAPEVKEVAPRLSSFMQTCQRERGVASAAFRKHLSRPERARAGWMVVIAGSDADERRAHAATVAHAAGAELKLVAMGSVVGKYIGETEKNLDVLLAAAEKDGALLFFDDADALFGKRTDVKDAHDKYANQEVSYLYKRLLALPDLVVVGVLEVPGAEKDARPGFDAVFEIAAANPPEPIRPWVRLCWPSR
jgi:SpoVK/Ycf46/Vps4 family AAA+-type ATPase